MKEYKYTINGNIYEVKIGDVVDNIITVEVNGEEFKVETEKPVEQEKPKPVVRPVAQQAESSSAEAVTDSSKLKNALKAPLPGVITDIKVAVGDEVTKGQTLVVLEAMKMANNLDADKAGKIAAILVQPGQSVMEDDALVIIE